MEEIWYPDDIAKLGGPVMLGGKRVSGLQSARLLRTLGGWMDYFDYISWLSSLFQWDDFDQFG